MIVELPVLLLLPTGDEFDDEFFLNGDRFFERALPLRTMGLSDPKSRQKRKRRLAPVEWKAGCGRVRKR